MYESIKRILDILSSTKFSRTIYIYIVITLINAHIDIRDILQQFIREDREARIHIATINKFSLGCGFCAPTAAEINTGMQEK